MTPDRQKAMQKSPPCISTGVLKKEFVSNNAFSFPECSMVEALESATLHPAELLNITDRKGTLGYASDADFLLLSDDLDLVQTYIAGQRVWNSPENGVKVISNSS